MFYSVKLHQSVICYLGFWGFGVLGTSVVKKKINKVIIWQNIIKW